MNWQNSQSNQIQTLPEAGEVKELPGYGKVKEKQLAGNLPVTDDNKAFIYFWFFRISIGSGK